MGLVIHQNRMTGRKRTKTTNIQQKHLQIFVPLNYRPKIKGLVLIVLFALKNEILVKIDFSPKVSKFIEMEVATSYVGNQSKKMKKTKKRSRDRPIFKQRPQQTLEKQARTRIIKMSTSMQHITTPFTQP